MSSIHFYIVENVGAGSSSTGGEFELSGTIGQPDAGEMSGGDFTLAAGLCHGP